MDWYKMTLSVLLYICSSSLPIKAQIVPFTQYYNTPSLLNSSLTGLNTGMSVQLIHRNHWMAADNAFTTSGVVSEFNVKNDQHSAGLAFFLLNDAFGNGLFSNNTLEKNTIGTSVSHHSAIGDNKFLSGGVSLRLVQTSLNWENLIFSPQIHRIFGSYIGAEPGAFPPETAYTNPAIHVGTNYIQKGLLTKLWEDLAHDDYFEIGLSYGSVITMRNSIYNFEIFERKRLTAHFRSELISNNKSESNNRIGLTGRFDRISGNGSELALNSYMIHRSVKVGAGFQSTLTARTYGENIHRLNVTAGYVAGNQENDTKNKLCITYNYAGAINAISNSRLGNNHEISLIVLLTEKGFKKSRGIRQTGFL